MNNEFSENNLSRIDSGSSIQDLANKNFTKGADNINYVIRANDSSFNMLRSESYFLERLFNCKIDELTTIIIQGGEASRQIENNLFEPINERSYSHRFFVKHDRLKLSFSEVVRLKNTNIILYFSQSGWVCKRSDFPKIKDAFESWKLTPSSYNSEALDKVFWTEKTISIKRDVEFFSVSKKWFDTKDLPYSRSYLLYGPPGNGKTSVIRAISEFFHSTPETFSFTAPHKDPDAAFQEWVIGEDYSRDASESDYGPPIIRNRNREYHYDEPGSNPKIRILLLEDIDRFFSNDNVSKLPVSFSTVLNSLDGVIQRKNSIIIATANNPEKIDSQVLCRPGRFDLRVPFEAPTERSIIDFINKLSDGDNLTEKAVAKVASICKGHSLSFAKGVYLSAANRAFSRSSIVINDDDIIGSAEEFSVNLGREIKSVKSGAGF